MFVIVAVLQQRLFVVALCFAGRSIRGNSLRINSLRINSLRILHVVNVADAVHGSKRIEA